jgi:hypothetical protein
VTFLCVILASVDIVVSTSTELMIRTFLNHCQFITLPTIKFQLVSLINLNKTGWNLRGVESYKMFPTV